MGSDEEMEGGFVNMRTGGIFLSGIIDVWMRSTTFGFICLTRHAGVIGGGL